VLDDQLRAIGAARGFADQGTKDFPMWGRVRGGALRPDVGIDLPKSVEVDGVACSEQCAESFVRVVLRVIIEGPGGIPVCTALHDVRTEGFVLRESGQRGNVMGERTEKATRVMVRVPSVRTLVVREPAAAGGDTRNRVEHGVRVAGVAQVDEAAVGRVHEVRWKRVVVEKGGNVVLRLEEKVVVRSLDDRRHGVRRRGGRGRIVASCIIAGACCVCIGGQKLRAETSLGGLDFSTSLETIRVGESATETSQVFVGKVEKKAFVPGHATSSERLTDAPRRSR